MVRRSSGASIELVRWADARAAAGNAAELLAVAQVLPVFDRDGEQLVLATDLARLGPLTGSGTVLELGRGTRLDLGAGEADWSPALGPAVRNLAQVAASAKEQGMAKSLAYFGRPALVTHDERVAAFAELQLVRSQGADELRAAAVARGTSFLGSKRSLAAYLTEAAAGHLPDDGVVLDLMTGSGAAAAAFARVWPTVASDAQSFGTRLAAVQGAGLAASDAERIAAEVLRYARANAAELEQQLAGWLDAEGRLFRSPGSELVGGFRRLLSEFPTIAQQVPDPHWHPQAEQARRRADPGRTPYCLFTAYFANVFFGIRQAVEIDSLRYGVDQLPEHERGWALGALIAAASDLATTFGGHFAQPSVREPERLNDRNAQRLVEQRSLSVAHEFTFRLMRLAADSERSPRPVETVPGPWRTALDAFAEMKPEAAPALVYFDPPYQRDEYSRYYHVLETLVRYDYPSVTGRGLVPDKRAGERFASEFFSRRADEIVNRCADVIAAVLERGWSCLWSYSNVAAVGVLDVIESVATRHDCTVESYSAAYRHRVHGSGGGGTQPVKEYLVAFAPSPGGSG